MMQYALLGPTSGREQRNSNSRSWDQLLAGSIVQRPKVSLRHASALSKLRVFLPESPDEKMSSVTLPAGASRSSSQLSKASVRRKKAFW